MAAVVANVHTRSRHVAACICASVCVSACVRAHAMCGVSLCAQGETASRADEEVRPPSSSLPNHKGHSPRAVQVPRLSARALPATASRSPPPHQEPPCWDPDSCEIEEKNFARATELAPEETKNLQLGGRQRPPSTERTPATRIRCFPSSLAAKRLMMY